MLTLVAWVKLRWWDRRQPHECTGAHDTGPMLWPGTAHQGVICRRCGRFLPC